MSHKVVFVTERSPHHQSAALAAAPDGCEVTMMREPSLGQLRARLSDTEILISERAGVVDADLIARAPKLRLIQRLGSLHYDIDIQAAQQHDVAVCFWPLQGCVRVAEHMVMQMLALTKRLPEVIDVANKADDWGRTAKRTDENQFAYNWSSRAHIGGLSGRTVGILGFGEIGVELARRLQGFDVASIRYHKRRQLPQTVEDELGLSYATPAEIAAQSDVLCVLLPYTSETDQLLDSTIFSAMPEGSYLVHCGSGSVIDEAALASALSDGHLAGAALDTFEWEPLRADNPLVALANRPTANVLLTPHTAAGTDVDRSREWENVRRLLADEPLAYQVV